MIDKVVSTFQSSEQVGSYDEASSIEQIKVIDAILQVYFQTENWIEAREKQNFNLLISQRSPIHRRQRNIS